MSKKAPGAPPRFVLWREVLVAYLMPAVTAGLGGAATGQRQLVIAALTTIGGTSALVAAALGSVLRRRPVRSRPPRTPRVLAAATLGLLAAGCGLAVGLGAAHWLPHVPGLAGRAWPDRLPIDLPASSAIAATITTWRWRGSRRTPAPQHRPDSHTHTHTTTPTAPQPERQTS
ncbi:hypothetical protein ACIRD3_13820 [Kitasatospora sp. NPDC093550]|uniref:hypothetical protein n=1 Tax=Kitasatospora sp. NPDC093550 TaxID=3364089 RepID=UPI00381000FF